MNTWGAILNAFMHDAQLKIAVILIFLDFVFGVLAAFHHGNFRASYVADFLRNDIAFKLVPWFFLYGGSKVAGHVDILIPGLDLGVLAGAAFATLAAAWTASILGSLAELRLPGSTQTVTTAVAGAENSAPPKD